MEKEALGKALLEVAYLEGDFVLRSGRRSRYYLDKYLFETDPRPSAFLAVRAAGLPVVTNPWIGDAGALASEPVWVLADDFTATIYRAVASRLAVLLSRQSATRLAARELARREFSLESAVARYSELYLEVLDR